MGLLYEVMTADQAMQERYQVLQDKYQLLADGEYDAVITASKDTVSSRGSPMMDLTLTVYDNSGNTREIRDFLVFTKPMMWKVIHFSSSAGLVNEYEQGRLCSDVAINKVVRVKVSTDKGKQIPADKLNGKPVGTCYYDKNKIDDYVAKKDSIDNQDLDDDIPFL